MLWLTYTFYEFLYFLSYLMTLPYRDHHFDNINHIVLGSHRKK